MTAVDIPFEVIFVNDNFKDDTWEEIEKTSERYDNIHGICFSRNFGKEAAVFAGLSEAKGDCCIVMDCDLQHPVEIIVPMYSLWKNGYEVVHGVKNKRKDENIIRKTGSRIFHAFMSKCVGTDMSEASDFMLLDKKVVSEILDMKEKNMFLRGISYWIGYKQCQVQYNVQDRESGNSKWNMPTLFKYALNSITSFSNAPLYIIFVFGTVSILFAFIMMLHSVFSKNSVEMIAGVVFFVGSILMFGIGIIGIYVGKIYDEVKNRPKYVIVEKFDTKKFQ